MQTITIAGRAFKGVGRECTLAHDVWVMQRLRQCQLDQVRMLPGESADEYAKRFILQAAGDPNVFELLGGLLMPADIPATAWTPELAAETGRHLANVTTLEDKQIVKHQITEASTAFFLAGLPSSKTSQKSSQIAESRPQAQTSAL